MELIRGIIIEQERPTPWHNSVVSRLLHLLHECYGAGAQISGRSTVGFGDHSEPNPDVAVLRWRDDYYADQHPKASDVILLIEVADTSRAFDLGTKHDLYAEQGIAEFWVVDRQMAGIHVFRRPRDGVFTETRLYSKGESIPLPECDGASFLVDDSGV